MHNQIAPCPFLNKQANVNLWHVAIDEVNQTRVLSMGSDIGILSQTWAKVQNPHGEVISDCREPAWILSIELSRTNVGARRVKKVVIDKSRVAASDPMRMDDTVQAPTRAHKLPRQLISISREKTTGLRPLERQRFSGRPFPRSSHKPQLLVPVPVPMPVGPCLGLCVSKRHQILGQPDKAWLPRVSHRLSLGCPFGLTPLPATLAIYVVLGFAIAYNEHN
ncbi:hypothetical protein H4582DRAFT_2058006 [Lactarius indigo]|nr:hypothetical protein H4582DRAFT_2058006 [Lactarius indigo]